MRKTKNMNTKLLKISAVLAASLLAIVLPLAPPAPAETSVRKAHPMLLR